MTESESPEIEIQSPESPNYRRRIAVVGLGVVVTAVSGTVFYFGIQDTRENYENFDISESVEEIIESQQSAD